MISTAVLLGTALSALIALATPFVVYFGFRRRMDLRLRNILVGAVTFVIAVVVLEAWMHYYLMQANAQTKAWFAANALGTAVYAALAAAVFEETGRLLAMRVLAKAVAGNGTPVAYGIGHAGAECVFIALNIGIVAVLGYLISTGQTGTLNLGADTTKTITDSLAGATFVTSLFGGIERIIAFVFQIAFSLLVWHAVSARRIGFYWVAVAFHFLVDFPAGLAQQKLLPLSVGEIEAGYALLAVIVLAGIWAFARPAETASNSAAR